MDLSLVTEDSLPVDVGYLHLVRLLGEGSCGRSFAAESRGTGGLPHRVAVTVLPSGLFEDQQRWRDVQTEVSRAALLRHRGIVRTFSLAVESGSPYLTSELVEGVNLKQMLDRGGPLTPRQGLDIGIQLISALGAAHESRPGTGDIPQPHGELRPSAVMLSVEGVVKLRGFGLAKVSPSRPGLAAVGFAAPEALSGQRLTLGTDLFSLGGLLFFLLTGEVPFPVHLGASAGERIAALVKGLRGGRVLSHVDRVVPGLGDALGRMLCLDPTLRFSSAGEAEAVFREVRGALPRSSRLNEVITERFGEGFPDAQVQSGAAPGLLEVELSRDLGVPAPPPIPVPIREIVDAPRAGPVLVAPGPVSVPPQEAFRPPTPAPAPSSVARPQARGAQESGLPAPSPLEEISLDFDENTTDSVAPLDLLPERSASSPGSMTETAPRASAVGMDPRSSELAGGRPSLERADPTAAPAPALAPRVSNGKSSTKGGPLQRALVWVVCGLTVLVLALVAVVNLGGAPESQSGTSAASSDDVEAGEAGGPPSTETTASGLGQQEDSPDRGSGPSGSAVGGPDSELQLESSGEDPGASDRRSSRGADGSSNDSPPDRRDERAREERARLRREALERRRAREAKTRQEPVEVDSGSRVELSIVHSPIRSARMGSSELVTVRMDAPRSSKVVLHAGPPGGPYKKTRLKAKSGGRWEGWIDFRGTSVGEDFHYWLVASHPRASESARLGSRSAPNRVEIE